MKIIVFCAYACVFVILARVCVCLCFKENLLFFNVVATSTNFVLAAKVSNVHYKIYDVIQTFLFACFSFFRQFLLCPLQGKLVYGPDSHSWYDGDWKNNLQCGQGTRRYRYARTYLYIYIYVCVC